MVHCDDKAAITLCEEHKENKRAKHIDIVHHVARERVASGEVEFVHCRSDENVSDYVTKALPRPLFEAGLRSLRML